MRPARFPRQGSWEAPLLSPVPAPFTATASLRVTANSGPEWCPQKDSNFRPLPYQGSALPLSYVGAPRRAATRGPARLRTMPRRLRRDQAQGRDCRLTAAGAPACWRRWTKIDARRAPARRRAPVPGGPRAPPARNAWRRRCARTSRSASGSPARAGRERSGRPRGRRLFPTHHNRATVIPQAGASMPPHAAARALHGYADTPIVARTRAPVRRSRPATPDDDGQDPD